jgi:hypothetical protein
LEVSEMKVGLAGVRSSKSRDIARSRMFVRVTAGLCAFALAGIVSAARPLAAGATGTLDQSMEIQTDLNGVMLVGQQFAAQTFTAGLSGPLDQIDLRLTRYGEPTHLIVEIRPVEYGYPTATVLASANVFADRLNSDPYTYEWIPVALSPAPTVTAGSEYAIVVRDSGGNSGWNFFMWADTNGSPYTAGWGLTTVDGGTVWYGGYGEFPFRTYVVSNASPGGLAPDGSFEQSAYGSYFTNGSCGFAWATDQARSPTHSRRIVATSTGLCRWLSQTRAIEATPGTTYDASVFVKTNLVQDGSAYLSLNFWTADGAYVPSTVDSPQQIAGTKDWTPVFVEAKAPPGAAFVRLEFRLSGRGTAWFDDAGLTTVTGTASPQPPDTTILHSDVVGVPAGPYSFAFTSDQFDAGFQCSFEGSPFETCTSPVTIALTAGRHTFAVRAVNQAGLVDPTPATQTLTVSGDVASNLAPDPDFREDPGGSYFTNGDATFSWSSDNGHESVGFLQIAATGNTLNRWLSRTSAIPATPGARYHVSVWAKTQAVDGRTQLSVNFWTAGGAYIPATIDSATQLSGTTDWTQLSVDATAPPGTAFMRVEFRQTGPGTSRFDDIAVAKE